MNTCRPAALPFNISQAVTVRSPTFPNSSRIDPTGTRHYCRGHLQCRWDGWAASPITLELGPNDELACGRKEFAHKSIGPVCCLRPGGSAIASPWRLVSYFRPRLARVLSHCPCVVARREYASSVNVCRQCALSARCGRTGLARLFSVLSIAVFFSIVS